MILTSRINQLLEHLRAADRVVEEDKDNIQEVLADSWTKLSQMASSESSDDSAWRSEPLKSILRYRFFELPFSNSLLMSAIS